jgi:hypothetical protein
MLFGHGSGTSIKSNTILVSEAYNALGFISTLPVVKAQVQFLPVGPVYRDSVIHEVTRVLFRHSYPFFTHTIGEEPYPKVGPGVKPFIGFFYHVQVEGSGS